MTTRTFQTSVHARLAALTTHLKPVIHYNQNQSLFWEKEDKARWEEEAQKKVEDGRNSITKYLRVSLQL